LATSFFRLRETSSNYETSQKARPPIKLRQTANFVRLKVHLSVNIRISLEVRIELKSDCPRKLVRLSCLVFHLRNFVFERRPSIISQLGFIELNVIELNEIGRRLAQCMREKLIYESTS